MMLQYNLLIIPLIIALAIYWAGRNKPRHLIALAILGFATVYGPVAVGRLQVWNVFHYYLGAKYFNELGYNDLYACALHVGGPGWVDPDGIRDLYKYSYEVQHNLNGCPVTNFTGQRLHEFATDIAWLHEWQGDKPMDKLWPAIFRDKGLNTTPVWLIVASPLANLAPVGGLRFWLLLYSDFFLIVAGLIVAARRFGAERTALAAVFLVTWPGTYPQLLGHWFQYPWLLFVLIGVATYRNRPFESGFALTVATALRIFPGALFLAPLIQGKKTPPRFWHGVGGAAVILFWLFLVPMEIPRLMTGTKPAVMVEFLSKMAKHSAYIVSEPGNFGLRNLAYTLLDWPGSAANWEAFAKGGQLATAPAWLDSVWWVVIVFAAILIGLSIHKMTKRQTVRFSDTLPVVFGALVLSRYYYVVNVIYALEHEPKRARYLLLVNLIIFLLVYYVHPIIGYLVGQLSLLLFYWRYLNELH